MKHIALLLPDLEVGGAQRVMLMLAREFTDAGHMVDLLVSHEVGQLREHIPSGIRLVNIGGRGRLPGSFGLAIRSVAHLTWWLRRHRPDVVLSSVTGVNLVAILARRISRMPHCLVIREAGALDNVNSRWRLRAMQWLYPHADVVVVLSQVMGREMTSRLGVSERRIHYIPNPVDTEYVCKQAEAPVDHPWFSADSKAHVIISVGRLIPQKDYETLLRAFSIASRKGNLRLVIVGEGPLRATLEALVAHLQISNLCHLLGFDSNPWRWMARSDLFVLSSRSEGHPNSLLEALALGVPALVTAYDESVYDMAEHFHFTVVPLGDIEAMAQAMLAVKRGRPHGDRLSGLASPGNAATEYLRLFSNFPKDCEASPTR